MSSVKRKADVVITGGGASGLAAAVELGIRAPELNVLVIEKMDEPGRKLRATGNGRCNITNTSADGFSRIMAFFREIGLVTRTYENGLVYPYSESAADVVRLLTDRAASLGTVFACGEEVTSLACTADEGFRIESVKKDRDGVHCITSFADKVILAAGGKAGPGFGTSGDGFRLARELGHSIVTPVPALTAVECSEWEDKASGALSLGGTRSAGTVRLYRDRTRRFAEDTKIFEEDGEIQFTRTGISGICVFNMTRHMRFSRADGESLSDFLVRLDLFPGGDIRGYIEDRKEGCFADASAAELLMTILKEPLAGYVTAAAGIAPKAVSALTDEDIGLLEGKLHSLEFHPAALRGWKEAQVTSGGVSLDEIDEASSGSKLVSGLYITGELADRDFPCGGFNLSNAWVTGLAAADSIAEGVRR